MAATTRQPTNVTLPKALVAQARELNVNISAACEAGLTAQVKRPVASLAEQQDESSRALDLLFTGF